MTTVLTLGTFDVIHSGHVYLFAKCRELAGPEGRVIVAVNEDAFIQAFKGHKPVQTVADRLIMVRAIRYVDDTVINLGGGQQPALINWLDPDYIVIGDDWAPPKDYLAQLGIDQDFLNARGIEVVYLPRLEGLSSTALKAQIRA